MIVCTMLNFSITRAPRLLCVATNDKCFSGSMWKYEVISLTLRGCVCVTQIEDLNRKVEELQTRHWEDANCRSELDMLKAR